MALPDPNYRYAMAKYATDGVRTDWQIAFDGGYLFQADVYAYSYLTADRSDRQVHPLTFISEAGDNATVRITPAVAANRTLFIVRLTQRGDPLVDFINRSMLTEKNLNTITEQAIYSVAELEDAFRELEATTASDAANALAVAQEARQIAQTAESTAEAAQAAAAEAFTKAEAAEAGIAAATTAANNAQNAATNAAQAANAATALVQNIQGEVNAAVATANAASANAEAASQAAQAIAGVAQDAKDTADDALAQVQTAVNAANNAVTVANAVDGKAQQALDNSEAAQTAAGNALSKTAPAQQSVASMVVWNGFMHMKNGWSVLRERSTTTQVVLAEFLNGAGSAQYAYFATDTGASDDWRFRIIGPQGKSSMDFYNSGGIINRAESSIHNIMRDGMCVWSGNAGDGQAVLFNIGNNNMLRRWAYALENNGDMTLWSYNASSGGVARVLSFGNRGTDANAWTSFESARCYFTGIVDCVNWVGGTSLTHSPDTYGTAGLITRGQWGGGLELQDGGNALKLWLNGGAQTAGFNMHSVNQFAGTVLQFGLLCKARGGFQALSSRHAKHIHGKSPYGLAEVLRIARVIGRYKDQPKGSQAKLFFIAEQLRNIVPEMVGDADFQFGDQMLPTVDYDQGVVVAFQAIEELYDLVSEAITDIDARVSALENKA